MNQLDLTIAVGDYDHVRDVTSGRIPVAGATLRPLHLPVEEVFGRFAPHREWEISEFSMGKFTSLVAAGDTSLVGLPVFPSRVFRHSSIYVRAGSEFSDPGDLAGRRIGIPEWAQTASIYTRGILQHEYGVDLAGVEWLQAGVNQAGRREKVALALPAGVSVTHVSDRSLTELLLAGELDAVLSARPPAACSDGSGRIVRLVGDYPRVEREYYERTGVFPIMHVLVLRADVHEAHPWLARNLVEAFEQAKQASFRRLRDITASWIPLPWTSARAEDFSDLVGEDPWPYGVEPNRKTLEAFLKYGHEQGVCQRLLRPEDLFPDSAMSVIRV